VPCLIIVNYTIRGAAFSWQGKQGCK